MPILNQCCFCISLPRGGIIMGSLSLIGAILVLILTSFGLARTYQEPHTVYGNLSYEELIGNFDSETGNVPMNYVYAMLWLSLLVSIALIFCSFLMIMGSYQRRRNLLVPYLAMGVIGLLLSLINVLVALTVSWTVIGFKEAIYFIFDIGIQVYFWLCAYSLYQWLKEEEKRPQIHYATQA